MKITKEQIEHVSQLACLDLTHEEKERLRIELGHIIAFVNKLDELDTGDIAPTDHICDTQNAFRKDIVEPSYERERILKNAPSQKDGCFLVPQILD